MLAAVENHAAIARALVAAGANANTRTLEYKFQDLVGGAGGIIHDRPQGGLTALMLAARQGALETGEVLLAGGAEINAEEPQYGFTAMQTALFNGHYAFAKMLLDKGASVNARTKESPPIRQQMLATTGTLEWVDFTGQTPFIRAALAGDVTVMKLLLARGADPKISTFSGTTALMAAAGVNWVVDQTADEGPKALLEAVQLCVELGLDVNAINSMGLTAVHGAANRGSDDIIRFLASKGARLDVKDKEGRTPLVWAEGVFLATHPARPKPSSIALLKELTGGTPTAASIRE